MLLRYMTMRHFLQYLRFIQIKACTHTTPEDIQFKNSQIPPGALNHGNLLINCMYLCSTGRVGAAAKYAAISPNQLDL